jgi:hypothetical protein
MNRIKNRGLKVRSWQQPWPIKLHVWTVIWACPCQGIHCIKNKNKMKKTLLLICRQSFSLLYAAKDAITKVTDKVLHSNKPHAADYPMLAF